MNQVDVVICSLPSLHLDHPPGAPALLQAALESSGIGAQSMDLSIDFFINQCSRDVNKSHVLWLDNDILLEIHDTINQIRQLDNP